MRRGVLLAALVNVASLAIVAVLVVVRNGDDKPARLLTVPDVSGTGILRALERR